MGVLALVAEIFRDCRSHPGSVVQCGLSQCALDFSLISRPLASSANHFLLLLTVRCFTLGFQTIWDYCK